MRRTAWLKLNLPYLKCSSDRYIFNPTSSFSTCVNILRLWYHFIILLKSNYLGKAAAIFVWYLNQKQWDWLFLFLKSVCSLLKKSESTKLLPSSDGARLRKVNTVKKNTHRISLYCLLFGSGREGFSENAPNTTLVVFRPLVRHADISDMFTSTFCFRRARQRQENTKL
jgi:hypothetical protein